MPDVKLPPGLELLDENAPASVTPRGGRQQQIIPPAGLEMLSPNGTAQPTQSESSTTAGGLAASFARGAAPYAAGAAIGAAAGTPFGVVGAVPGAMAGIGATMLSQLAGDVYNWLTPYEHIKTPQDLTDTAFDAIGLQRPSTAMESAAESAGGLAGSMMGVPTAPRFPVAGAALTPAQSLLRDFEAQKVTPTVPAVGQGGAAGLASNIGTRLPVTGPVIRGSVSRQLGETAEAATRGAGQFGTAQDAAGAGSMARNAAKRFAEDRSQATRDYRAFFQAMQGAPPAPMTQTLKVVNDLMGRFKNVPELTGLFTSSPIARLREALTPRTVQIPAQTSSILGPGGGPVVTQAAQTVQRGGVLSMDELQELRSQVGYQLEHPSFGPDSIPRAQIKRLYAALTQDMNNAARAKGPAATRALIHATTNYGTRMRLIDRLEPLVSSDAPERTFTRLNSAAMSSGTADAGLLQAAKKVMTPEEWGDFGASIVSRLGTPTANARDVLSGTDFSPGSYSTSWNKISDRAKDLLFGANTRGSPRAGLEQLARVAQAEKNVGKLANVSHSGEYGIGAFLAWEAAKAAWAAMTTGNVGPLLGWGAASGAGYGFAKLITSPQFARWMYGLPRTTVVTPALVAQSAANLINSLTSPKQAGAPQTRESPIEFRMPDSVGLPQTMTDPYASQIGVPP